MQLKSPARESSAGGFFVTCRQNIIGRLTDRHIEDLDIAALTINVEEGRKQDDVTTDLMTVFVEVIKEDVEGFLANALGTTCLPFKA